MSFWRASYEPLIGAVLQSVEMIDDKGAVRFILDNGKTLTYDTYGDCCSHTWIEHITIPNDIFGAYVTSFTEPQLPPHAPLDEPDAYEYVAVYHTAFQTTKGEIIVEYRNSSNGYYGGNLTGPREISGYEL